MKQVHLEFEDGKKFVVHAGSWDEMIKAVNVHGHNYTLSDVISANVFIPDSRFQCHTVKQTLEN